LLCVVPAMITGIEMRFMRISRFREHLIELACAEVEAVIVLGSTVEVQLESVQFLRIDRKSHRIVGFPVSQIGADSINPVEESLKTLQPAGGHFRCRKVLKKHGT